MKKYILILFIVNYFFDLNAQAWSEKYCLNFLNELAEKDSSITDREIEAIFGSRVDSFYFHSKSLYFNKSDKIKSLLIMHNNFIDKLHPEYVTDHGSARENIYYTSQLYLESLNYKANDNLGLVYEILKSSSHNLLNFPLEKLNATQLIELYISQNEANRRSILSTIVSGDLFDKIQLDSFWHAIDPIEKSNLEVYQMKLDYADRFENSNQRDSVINQVKQQFIQLMDTNNPRHVMLFKQNFDFENYMNALARESIRKNDSTRLAEKTIEAQRIHQKNDSIINTIDWSKWTNYNKNNLIELVEKGEDIEPYVNFNPSTLSPDEYREYLALLDTTLHDFNDDYFTPDIGDDGRRFDTLDNVDLFTELLKINLDELKREYNTVSIINTQPRLIHLQKIVQLIGDRYISKQLIPNASQQSQIDSLLNFIEYNMMIDSNDLWESISIDLMYRLWFLGVPKIKSWIKTDNYALNRFLGQNLHYFADEAMVKELVQKFEDEYATGNKYEATSYLGPLQYIDFLKKVDKYELHLPPRRVPQRTFDQSQEWCEKYIYPAFVKVGWLIEKK